MEHTTLPRGSHPAFSSSTVGLLLQPVEAVSLTISEPDPQAAQQFAKLVFNIIDVGESEDCLYLNVYAPSTPPPPQGRAVMLWIHGGK